MENTNPTPKSHVEQLQASVSSSYLFIQLRISLELPTPKLDNMGVLILKEKNVLNIVHLPVMLWTDESELDFTDIFKSRIISTDHIGLVVVI